MQLEEAPALDLGLGLPTLIGEREGELVPCLGRLGVAREHCTIFSLRLCETAYAPEEIAEVDAELIVRGLERKTAPEKSLRLFGRAEASACEAEQMGGGAVVGHAR